MLLKQIIVDNWKKKLGLMDVQSHHFLGPQIFIKKMMKRSKTFLKFWCYIYVCVCKRFQITFHLWKYLVMDVGITPMSLCCVSFSFYFGKKNDYYNDFKKKLWIYICCLILHLQPLWLQVLIFGCPKDLQW
jgi:hypothetical protein